MLKNTLGLCLRHGCDNAVINLTDCTSCFGKYSWPANSNIITWLENCNGTGFAGVRSLSCGYRIIGVYTYCNSCCLKSICIVCSYSLYRRHRHSATHRYNRSCWHSCRLPASRSWPHSETCSWRWSYYKHVSTALYMVLRVQHDLSIRAPFDFEFQDACIGLRHLGVRIIS